MPDASISPTAESPMTITTLAPWAGNNRTLAPRIVAELGEHKNYWEVFCGGLPTLLVKPVARMETVNDLHFELTNLARVIADPVLGCQLYRRLRRTLMVENRYAELDQAVRRREPHHRSGPVDLNPEEQLEWAYGFFIVSWMGRNGCAGQPASKKGTFCARFSGNGGHAGTRFRSAVDSIPAWRRRLRGVCILNRDGFGLLERIRDEAGTAVYVDPPFIEKGFHYLHDFRTEDHDRLSELLHRFAAARVVLRYYDHPAVRRLYGDWTIRAIDINKQMVNSCASDARQGPTKAPELLILNGPSLVEPSEAPLLEGCS